MTTQGHETRFALGPNHATNLATKEFAFMSCDINKRGTLIRSNNIKGQRAPTGDKTQEGPYTVDGPVTIHPTAEDLDFLLPYILGAVESTDVFNMADTLPELVATIDRALKVYTYRGLKVARATFRSRKGENLSLELQFAGKTADTPAASGSFPDIASTLTTKLPYVHNHSTLTFDGEEIEIDDVVLVIDNRLELDHHNNSLTRTSIPEGEPQVTLAFNTEHDANFVDTLQDIPAAGVSGATLAYTDGTDTLTITLGRLQKPHTPIPIQGKGSIRPAINLEAFEDVDGGVAQISITNTNV